MRKPPPSIAVVSALFLALGCFDLYRGLAPWVRAGAPAHFAADDALVAAIGVAAVVGGTFLLLGRNWARWLLAAWMLFHVVLSIRAPIQLIAHVAIFGAIAFVLFRPEMAGYFGRAGAG